MIFVLVQQKGLNCSGDTIIHISCNKVLTVFVDSLFLRVGVLAGTGVSFCGSHCWPPFDMDPRDLVALEPLYCPSMFQDLAESGLLEREAAFVSKEVTRATKLSTNCSIFVS